MTGAESDESAFELYLNSKQLFRDTSFNLHKFRTNSTCLQKRIDQFESLQHPSSQLRDELNETHTATTLGDFFVLGVKEEKVLGVRWMPDEDSFVFDVTSIVQLANTLTPTKRNVISVVGRFFDPLGFLSPVIIPFKVFFQELCTSKIGWDEELTPELTSKWNSLMNGLNTRDLLSIPRSYLAGNPGTVQFCGFCDASTLAYAAVVYLIQVVDSEVRVTFVAAKTRVAPLKTQTVPRLELLSALLLSRLIITVTECLQNILPQLEVKCYTDSQVALY